jgi:hypothetical protein
LVRVFWSTVYFGVCGIWVFVLLAATAQPLHAYIDPGSGLLLIQAAGSTLAGLAYLLRRRVRALFQRLMRRAEDADGGALR